MDESKKLDRLIDGAKRMLDVSRGELIDAIALHDKDSSINLYEAEDKHNNNIKRLNKLLNKKSPWGI